MRDNQDLPTIHPHYSDESDSIMKRILGLVKWFCNQLTKHELFEAAEIILDVLDGKHLDIKTKDNFKKEHPNYRKFSVDPESPLTECPPPKARQPTTDWKYLLEKYHREKGKQLKPVRRKNSLTAVPTSTKCPNCNAPSKFIYYNDGKKRIQLKCKVCDELFQARARRQKSQAKYWCPHCGYALYQWKQYEIRTIYKCPNDQCSTYLQALKQLNPKEQKLQKEKSSQFKLRYQYREYHYDPGELVPAQPTAKDHRIDRIHKGFQTFSLVLTFNISYGLSARMTAQILRNVFCINISYQTVLNYTDMAAVHCHKFNLARKAPHEATVACDETYIRVNDKWNYAWFTIAGDARAIQAYHLSDNRGVKHALITLKETVRDAQEKQTTTLVADGNPSYDAAVHAINADSEGVPLKRRKVIGLKNDDEESAEYRPFKQIVERLNRTYKFHTRARAGFKNFQGALTLTVLFVTHYNFLRPHNGLKYKCPITIDGLDEIQTIQGRWSKILQMATTLSN